MYYGRIKYLAFQMQNMQIHGSHVERIFSSNDVPLWENHQLENLLMFNFFSCTPPSTMEYWQRRHSEASSRDIFTQDFVDFLSAHHSSSTTMMFTYARMMSLLQRSWMISSRLNIKNDLQQKKIKNESLL